MALRHRAARARNWAVAREKRFHDLTRGNAMEEVIIGDCAEKGGNGRAAIDPTTLDMAAYLVERAIRMALPEQKSSMHVCEICRFTDVRKINEDILRMISFNNTGGVTDTLCKQLARKYQFFRKDQIRAHAVHCIPQNIYHYLAIVPIGEDEGEMEANRDMISYIMKAFQDAEVVREKAIEVGKLDIANDNIQMTIGAAAKVGIMTKEFDNPDKPAPALHYHEVAPAPGRVEQIAFAHPSPPPMPQRRIAAAEKIEDDEES